MSHRGGKILRESKGFDVDRPDLMLDVDGRDRMRASLDREGYCVSASPIMLM